MYNELPKFLLRNKVKENFNFHIQVFSKYQQFMRMKTGSLNHS